MMRDGIAANYLAVNGYHHADSQFCDCLRGVSGSVANGDAPFAAFFDIDVVHACKGYGKHFEAGAMFKKVFAERDIADGYDFRVLCPFDEGILVFPAVFVKRNLMPLGLEGGNSGVECTFAYA